MRVILRIKEVRQQQGLTLEKLAMLSNVSIAHLSYLERGEKDPTLTVLCRIAMALKVKCEDLYEIEK